MRQKLLAVAVSGALAALAAPASFAQSTSTISGTISVGIVATGASGAAGDPNVTSLGGGANAINISTNEDLGGGLKAGLQSQIRFSGATGDRASHGTGNALFHTANIFFTGGFGTFRIGKTAEDSNCGFDPWGCTGGAALMTGTGVSALNGGSAVANSIVLITPTVQGLSGQFGTSVSTRSNERRYVSVNYAQGPLTLQFLQNNNTANTGGDVAGGTPTITDAKARGQSVGASYDMGMAKVNFTNVVLRDTSVKTSNVTSLSGSVPMGAYTWLAGYNKARTASGAQYSGVSSLNDTKFSIGVNYALSKRTTLGADIYNAEAANASTGWALRARHTF